MKMTDEKINEMFPASDTKMFSCTIKRAAAKQIRDILQPEIDRLEKDNKEMREQIIKLSEKIGNTIDYIDMNDDPFDVEQFIMNVRSRLAEQ